MKAEGNDIEELVVMAEKVSEKINSLNNAATNIRTLLGVSFIVLYVGVIALFVLVDKPSVMEGASYYINASLFVLSVIFASGGAYSIAHYLSKAKRCKSEKESEKEILRNLLDMIFEYKDHIHSKHMGFVEKAILDMRLKRIHFSVKR